MRKEVVPVDDQSSTLQSSNDPLPGSLALEQQKEAPPAVHPLGVMTSSPLRVTRSSASPSRNEHSSKDEIMNVSPIAINTQNQQSQWGMVFTDNTVVRSAPPLAAEGQSPGIGESQPQNDRKMFLVFVKVLLKYLEKNRR